MSSPAVGTTFTIYLPAMPAAISTVEPERPRLEIPTGTETVLLAEDEAAVRSFIRAVLQSGGYTVLEAVDGEDAVTRAGAHDGRIDLLLTDVVMPRLGGREVAETLTQRRPGLRVIFMSGYIDLPLSHLAPEHTSVAFLQKPFSSLQLARTVREVLDAP